MNKFLTVGRDGGSCDRQEHRADTESPPTVENLEARNPKTALNFE